MATVPWKKAGRQEKRAERTLMEKIPGPCHPPFRHISCKIHRIFKFDLFIYVENHGIVEFT